jgi:hypothetical protein
MRTFAYIFSIALIVIAFSLGIAACGTIINGTHEEVTIITSPNDAEITVDGRKIGKGSAECNLERGSVHYIDVKKDGYHPVHILTGIGVADWYWANIVLFFEYSWIDLITDAAYSVEPNPIVVTLSPGSGEPTFKAYDTSGSWIAPLPLEVIGAALLAFTVWLAFAIASGYK